MDATVFMAVMLAAAFHAGWNAMVKIDLDGFLSFTLIALAAGIVALLAVPFVAFPSAAAWRWLLFSSFLHTGYSLFLVQAYKVGDLGQVYPIARGTAPLMVCAVMALVFGEALSPEAMAGVALLVAGVWLMSIRGGSGVARMKGKPVAYALGTSVFIASYTMTDGLGARASGDAASYAIWLFLINAVWMVSLLFARRGAAVLPKLRPYWWRGLAGGAMSLGAYWIVIWATTLAPIAQVAALRETSVLFATAISVVVLREPLTRWRTVSVLTIVAGVVLARMG